MYRAGKEEGESCGHVPPHGTYAGECQAGLGCHYHECQAPGNINIIIIIITEKCVMLIILFLSFYNSDK